jgi:hypothetical protein
MKINTATVQVIELIKPLLVDIPTCIETGTHVGEGTWALSLYFNRVFTIEIVKELYEFNLATYDKILHPRTTFLLGSSIEVLKDLIPTINERYCLYLDAHGSGDDTGFDPSIGQTGTPIPFELEACINNPPALIIMDDYKDFGTMDYPQFDVVRKAVATLGNYKEYIFNDIGDVKSTVVVFHRMETK